LAENILNLESLEYIALRNFSEMMGEWEKISILFEE
jgi:hypothetical protein